jgi:hypothetical protein
MERSSGTGLARRAALGAATTAEARDGHHLLRPPAAFWDQFATRRLADQLAKSGRRET